MDTLPADFPWTELRRYVRRRVDDPHLADDVVQEVAITAWKKGDQLRDPGAYKAWVFSIARRKVIDRFRALLRERTAPRRGAEFPRQPDDPPGPPELHLALRRALRRIPGRYAQVLILRYWYGLSFRALRSTLGGSEVNLRVLAHRARKALEGQLRILAA
jgi:RNA polymerase sigma-70 factor (ECF subfamily)